MCALLCWAAFSTAVWGQTSGFPQMGLPTAPSPTAPGSTSGAPAQAVPGQAGAAPSTPAGSVPLDNFRGSTGGGRAPKDPLTHVLGPGDQILLFVRALPQEQTSFQVRPDGDFYYPALGDVHAAGLNIPQLQKLLERKLKKLLWNPKFRLSLTSVASWQVTVLGEVGHPGRIEIGPESTVLEVLTQAGGVTLLADSESAVLTHAGVKHEVPIKLDPSMVAAPTRIQDGDTLYVLPGVRVNVIGEVLRPGTLALPRANHTPEEALKEAGGAKPTSAPGRTVLLRQSSPGGILVDLSSTGAAIPPEAKELKEGDTLSIPPRQAVVFAGSPKVVPLQGGENILDVVTQVQVEGNYKDIKLIRAADIKRGHDEPEKIDLDLYFQHQDRSVLVPIHDGDVILLNVKKANGGFLGSIMSVLYPLSTIRMFLP